MCWGTSIPQIFSLSRKKINRTLTIMKQSFLGETLGFRDCGKHLLEKHNVSNCGNPVPALAGTAENSPPLSGGEGGVRKYKIPHGGAEKFFQRKTWWFLAPQTLQV